MQRLLPPDEAWRRLRDMHDVVEHQPAIAYAVHCLTLFDQLELTLELLKQDDWPDFDTPEPLAPRSFVSARVPTVAKC